MVTILSDRIRFLLGISRAPFLLLSLLCAVLGISAAVADADAGVVGAGVVDESGSPVWLAILAVSAAVFAHASVNAFNECADFRSGLDLQTSRTPFSGGSGSLPAAPQYLALAQVWAWLTFGITAAIGVYFLSLRGGLLAWLGATGLVLVIAYTPLINRFPWLCLIAPGVGFGPIMVVGSAIAVTGAAPPASVWSAAIMGVLASGLLLANQQPDARVDARFGRRHLTIVYGPVVARRILACLWVMPLLILCTALAVGGLPPLAAVVGLPLLLACYNAWQLLGLSQDAVVPTALLARNVQVCLITPACMIAVFFINWRYGLVCA